MRPRGVHTLCYFSHGKIPLNKFHSTSALHNGLIVSFIILLSYILGSYSNLIFYISLNWSSWIIHIPYHSVLFTFVVVPSYISLDTLVKEMFKLVCFIWAVFHSLYYFHLPGISSVVHFSSVFSFLFLVSLVCLMILEVWHGFPLLICK